MIRLAIAGLRHYWRLALMLGAGVFLAAAVLTGSLLVGDSVKATLRAQAAERVGPVEVALVGGDRFFTVDLAEDGAAPVLFVPGTISTPDKKKRANGIWIYGVDDQFWALAGIEAPVEDDFFAVGEPLFARLGVELGERVSARMELPGRVSRDAPLSGETEKTASVGGEITQIVPSSKLGRFSLFAEQTPALNVFVPLATLQAKLEKPGRANLILGGGAGDWELADAELKTRELASGGFELISDRVFVSDVAAAALAEVEPEGEGVLSYLINTFEANGASVPYSVATGIGSMAAKALGGDELADDEVLVNSWMAGRDEDGGLALKVGDSLVMRYFEVDDSREFVERERTFTVAGVVSMETPAMADGWVPEFPGLETADSLANWESGMPLDDSKILGPDEKYWDDYRATPKAFVSLAAAQEMWGNRFGSVTALRMGGGLDEKAIGSKLREKLSLTDLGMSVRHPQKEAAESVAGALDFGALFGSLSGFLIISALLLVSMLVAFGMEARASQIGLLGALGFSRLQVRKLFMWEGALVSLVAAVSGAFAGVLYTKVALWALGTVWRGASAGMEFQFDARPLSIVIGALATFVMAKLTIWFAGRKITAVPPRTLLAGETGEAEQDANKRGAWPKRLLVLGLIGGAIAIAAGFGLEGEKLAGAFFGAGFAFLLAGLAGFSLVLRGLERGTETVDLAALGRRNAVRKRGRSIAVAAMVASGVFLVAAVNAFRLKTDDDPARRDTGTGGFEFVGTATLPIYEDLNDAKVRDKFGLEDFTMEDLSFVRLRVRNDGEEASCLNLNHAVRPRVIAVEPEQLASRGAFRFAGVWKPVRGEGSPWAALSKSLEDGAVPVIGDKASVMWALKKKLGDTVTYPDGRGGEVVLRIVGLLENSVLQGNLVIADGAFKAHFPSDGGYEMFLVDIGGDEPREIIGEVTKGLDLRGVAFENAAERLAAYAQVQNTYISIFSVLGGLGVLLGTVGVGLVIARNVLERRAEMGVMSALGFRRKALVRMVLSEHLLLVVAGVLIGSVAALAAVAPNLIGRAGGFPLATVGVMVLAIAAGGMLFCVLSARLALRGSLLGAIRSE